ncbi:FAD-dependent oxidoreductase [Saccharopolyspora sp. HNM0983]|uniref:FAD-dependent oxidoreductase n=1 Tax=Saccharopolyspora montiporae TaxID=2781240 RepID=A0A929B7L7_9PSEU|nr:FAD-dependent oxidoreductase [Saccharopolyspora sp. HNM0983]MBE9373680.1 FAD-dependent oxidoreductase [Saccharopolyspora sp. HNM0983]
MSVVLPAPAESYDVVVVGSGAAGLTAAVTAAAGGSSVLVLEKASRLGGTSAVGGGVIWAPGNHLMAEAGFADRAEDARSYLAAGSGGRMSAAEIDRYVRTAPDAVRFLTGDGVRMRPLARPDYHPTWAGAARGRGLDQEPFDPGPWPGLADRLRSPTYLPLITMGERDELAGAAPDAALLQQRAERGVRTMGGALVGRLVVAALRRGVDVVAECPVTGLDRDGAGWIVTAGGRGIHTDAVVLASGGFEWNPALRRAFLPYPVTPISAPSNTGDGLVLGLGAGGAVDEMTAVWGVPVLAPPTAVYDGQPSGRMGNVELTLPGSVAVNTAGRRFVNEAANYHDLNRAFGAVDPGTGRFANVPAYLVFDRTYLERYPVAGSTPGVAEPWMHAANTPGELARALQIDPDGLADTLYRFNEHARRGADPDFARGASPQDRHLGDPSAQPNPCLAPVERAPFYAVPVHPGVLGTAGGLATDADGRVLDHGNDPIGGLYAAGNCAATLFRDMYPGGGATLGSAIVRAYRAGAHLTAGA